MKLLAQIALFLVLFPLTLSAQRQKKIAHKGDQCYQHFDYLGAAFYYRMALDIDSSSVELLNKYADALRMQHDYAPALRYYKRVYQMDRGKYFKEVTYHMGDLYMKSEDYKNAKKYFRRTLRIMRRDKDSFFYRSAVQQINSCTFAERERKLPKDITLFNIGPYLNTTNSEFSGFYFDDSTLYYSSLRPDSSVNSIVLDTANYTIEMLRAKLRNGYWVEEMSVDELASIDEPDLANLTFNYKRSEAFYSGCKNRQCNIYRVYHGDGLWSEPELFDEKVNMEGYTQTQPFAVKINGYNYLFFASNRPGGKGGMDIWYVNYYSNGEVSDPINLGPQINTPGNEICPFYSLDDSTFYFSSDWHHGFGGFDIFKSVGKPEKLDTVINMGVPINSSVNDTYFNHFNGKAVLTSNRKGSMNDKNEHCCNDLFVFEYDYQLPVKELSSFERLEQLLPVQLYFNNDVPSPSINDTVTDRTYHSTYFEYLTLEGRYKKEVGRGVKGNERVLRQDEIEDFFEDNVKAGHYSLEAVFPLLLEELEQGNKIELDIKGYASPLSESEYNRKLTVRRIKSVELSFRQYKGGVLEPYLNSGHLQINSIPFGEYKASKIVSDKRNDVKNSIYSREAAVERRVEIISARQM